MGARNSNRVYSKLRGGRRSYVLIMTTSMNHTYTYTRGTCHAADIVQTTRDRKARMFDALPPAPNWLSQQQEKSKKEKRGERAAL